MSGSPFDLLESNVMDVVETIFGETCTWQPSTGGPLQTETVLFKDKTKPQGVGGNDFPELYPTIEFKRSQFPTLKALVDDTKKRERVTIRGVVYGVRTVTTKYDGDTVVAQIDPKI